MKTLGLRYGRITVLKLLPFLGGKKKMALKKKGFLVVYGCRRVDS